MIPVTAAPKQRRSLGLLARHQTGALVASAVDFLMMICWVELRLGTSVSGAAVGAASGALTNFLLGRQWIFQAGHRSAAGQALRYVLVAAGSLGLNSLGQYIALRLIGLPYVFCRVIVAVLVGVCWNFPLHRRFVFAGGGRDRAPDPQGVP